MSQPGRDKDRGAGRSVHLAVLEPEAKRSLQNVPGFIVGAVDVQVGRPGIGPLADDQGVPAAETGRKPGLVMVGSSRTREAAMGILR